MEVFVFTAILESILDRKSQRQRDWGVGEQARVVVAQSAGDVAAAAAAVGGQVSGDLTVRGHGLATAEVQTGAAGLNYGDPEHSARPHPLICPDLVSELDILDCNVVPERKTRQCFPL